MAKRNAMKYFFSDLFRPLGDSLSGLLCRAGMVSLFFVVMEIVFRKMQGLKFTANFTWVVLFSIVLGTFFASLFSFFPGIVTILLSGIVMFAGTIWAIVQVCYYGRFQTHMEFSRITMGRDAANAFAADFASAITEKTTQIIILILIFVVFLFLMIFFYESRKKPVITCIVGIAASLAVFGITLGCMAVFSGGSHGLYKRYHEGTRILDNDVENFGLYTSFRLDLRAMVLGKANPNLNFEHEDMAVLLPGNKDSMDGAPETPAATPTPVPYNVMNIDFDRLLSEETDEALLNVHQYIAAQTGSRQNEYTGYFKGYNLVMVCAESFSGRMINEEFTPTLYKMANNGFVFNNYYGTFRSITTNGEFAFLTGLMPNTFGAASDLKTNSTFLATVGNYMPFTMANEFGGLGVSCYGYHGNEGTYYKRHLTHPNIGYSFLRFRDFSLIDGVQETSGKLVFSTGRPTSDYEMVEQTVDDYLSKTDAGGRVLPFHAYYMTYSGHHPYYDIHSETSSKSPMSYRNRDIVDNIDTTEEVRSYLASNLEVERAMTFLLERLEAAGCLENTVIVLTNDHYPYGLSDRNYKEMARVGGNPLDGDVFQDYENTFICYCAGMKEKVVVDTPCCTVDILPTLLNLFGMEYDSRLLSGTDILDPESVHIAMLYSKSFITDLVEYDATNLKTYYLVDEAQVPEGYVDACIAYVNNKFKTSLQMVEKDYYKRVLKKE